MEEMWIPSLGILWISVSVKFKRVPGKGAQNGKEKRKKKRGGKRKGKGKEERKKKKGKFLYYY